MTDDYSEDELREIHELMLKQGPTAVWARAQDRRRRDHTGSIEVTAGSSRDVPGELDRLRRRMAGKAGGRTPGSTTIVEDEQLRAPVREMRRSRVRITRKALAARSGFTEAEIRGYLKATGRKLAEFLASF